MTEKIEMLTGEDKFSSKLRKKGKREKLKKLGLNRREKKINNA